MTIKERLDAAVASLEKAVHRVAELGANSEITSHINEALAHIAEAKNRVVAAASAAVDHLPGTTAHDPEVSTAPPVPVGTEPTGAQVEAGVSLGFLEAVEHVKTKSYTDEAARKIVTENGVEKILDSKKREAEAVPDPAGDDINEGQNEGPGSTEPAATEAQGTAAGEQK